ELDTDRMGVDVAPPGPEGEAGMPGAAVFRYQAPDGPVFLDDIVRTHFRVGRGEARERRFGGRHAGVVENEHVDDAARWTRILIGRGPFEKVHAAKLRTRNMK